MTPNKTTSEPQEDPNILPLTPELENVNITAVYRKGSIHTNFVVIFKRKDKDIILYMKSQRDKTRSELEKTLKNYSKNKALIEELRVTLEPYIIEYFDQMCGIPTNNESQFNEEFDDNNQNSFDRYLDKNENDPLLDYQEVDIEKAAQLHKGKIKFTGRISAITPEIIQLVTKSRWQCRVCDNVIEIPFANLLNPPRMPKKCSCSQTDRGFDPDHELINARLLKIESDDITRQKAPLSIRVYLLDEYTIDTQISSRVTIYGEIENVSDPRNKYSTSFVIARRIIYQDRQALELTPEDIPRIMELRNSSNLSLALAALFAPHLKDFEFEKFLTILATLGAPTLRNPETGSVIQRGPLNLLFIGKPGCGKTAIASESVFLIYRSKELHGENTTKATLCGTVIQEEGRIVIKPGVAVLASGAVLFIDELDKAGDDILDGLLEMTERCTITIAKYAEHLQFNAEVSLISTCNPRNENWENKRKLELSDIPLTDRIISRFDIIIPIREFMTEQEWKDYADFISKRTIESISVNYELLMKYLEYARRIKFVTFDSDARERINSYAAKCAINKDLAYITSKRIVHTIHRIAGTFARLYLSDTVTAEIAEKVIDFLNQIIKRINLNKASFLKPTIDPLDIIINSILKMNPPIQRAIILKNHIEGLCQNDKELDAAIGMQDKPERRFKRNQNTALDTLCHKITQDSRIGVTGSYKEKVYCIKEKSNKESPDLESVRGPRGVRGDPFNPVNKKNIDIFDDESEVEKQATRELEEALDQSS